MLINSLYKERNEFLRVLYFINKFSYNFKSEWNSLTHNAP